MATLHLISNPQALASCLSLADSADVIILMEDAVYATSSVNNPGRSQMPKQLVIGPDLTIRGLPQQDNAISYEQLVALCTEHSPITSWC